MAYKASEMAQRIKLFAKQKKIKIATMLQECHFNKNTLSTMTSRGSMLKADSLAKIADYLG